MFGRNKSRVRKKVPEGGIGGLKISAPTPISAINVSGSYIDLRANPQGEGIKQTPQSASGHNIQPQPRPYVADISSQSASQPWLAGSRPETASSVQDYPRGQPQPVADRQDGRGRSGVSQVAAFDHKPSTANSNTQQRARRPSSPASVIHSPRQPQRDQYRGHLSPEPGTSRSVTPNGTKNFSRKIEASSTEEFYLPRGRAAFPPPQQVIEASRTDLDLNFDPPTVTQPIRRSISLDDDSRGRARQRTTQHLYEKRYPDLQEQSEEKSTEPSGSVPTNFLSGSADLYFTSSENRRTPEKKDTRSSSVYSRSPSPEVKAVAVPQQYPHIAEVRRLQTPEHPPPQHLQPQFQPRGRTDSKPEQLHSVAFFEGGARPAELPPVSPLLPSPPRRRRAESIEAEQRFAPVSPASSESSSPDFQSTANGPAPSLPPLDLGDLSQTNDEDLTRLTHLFASDADNHKNNTNMPGLLRTETRLLRGDVISSPRSPEQNKLPAYLGRLESIQTPQEQEPRDLATPTPTLEPDHDDQYAGQDEQMERNIMPKRSFSRKVSTKLRTLVGGRRAGPEGRNTPSPGANSPRGRFNKDAISNPIPIPEGEEPIDLQMEQVRAQFDIEAAARSPRAVVTKVNEWNYNPSAATSKSSLSSVQNASAPVATASASAMRPSYMSVETATVESEVSGTTNPGLSSHRSSVRSSERNITPDSEPMTPLENEQAFSALRGTKSGSVRDTTKSDITIRPQQPSIPTYSSPGQQSIEVPVFLDTTSDDHDARTSVGSKKSPKAPESLRAEFASSRVNSIMTSEVEKELEQRKVDQLAPPRLVSGRRRGDSDASSGSNSSVEQDRSALLSPASTAPSSVPPSPLPPISPLPPMVIGSLARKPSTARPPFGAGGKKPLLRAATMSSRSAGGTGGHVHARPMKPTKMQTNTPAPIMEADDSPPRPANPIRANTIDHHPAVHVKPSPKRRQFSRRQELQEEAAREPAPNRTFSFAQSSTAEDNLCLGGGSTPSEIHPDDSISRIGSAEPSPVLASPAGILPPPSPTPFDVDRSLPRRPTTASRPAPNTATLNTIDTPDWLAPPPAQRLKRSDTDWQPQLPLRPAKSFSNLRPAPPSRVAALSLNTSVPAAPTTLSAGAARPQTPDFPAMGIERTNTSISLNPSIKKSKSYGDGLRRAFSRRAPPSAPPPLPAQPSPPPFLPPPMEYDENPSNPASIGLAGGSEASLARWNTALAMTRSRSNSRAPTPLSRPGTSAATSRPGTSNGLSAGAAAAVKLTAELRNSIIHKPGTLFLKTLDRAGDVHDHYLKPRKGSIDKVCGFCGKGPFANMWLCLDDGCGFVVCRMCCNEKVQAEEAELF